MIVFMQLYLLDLEHGDELVTNALGILDTNIFVGFGT
jgi:hypothetical protein